MWHMATASNTRPLRETTLECQISPQSLQAKPWQPCSLPSTLTCSVTGMLQVVAYGISINLVEVTWKGKIKAQFPNPNDYSAFMGDFSSCTGAVTFLMMIASRFIFRKFGWGVAAQITPIVLLITGGAAQPDRVLTKGLLALLGMPS